MSDSRGLRRDDAAAYIGLSVTKFEQRVRAGQLPAPLPLGVPHIWDRAAIDATLNRISNIQAISPGKSDEVEMRAALHARKTSLRNRPPKRCAA